MTKEDRINKIYVTTCMAIFVFLFGATILTFFTQNILCERMHMDNAFVRFVLGDDKTDEIVHTWNPEQNVVVSWQEIYPFQDDMTVEVSSGEVQKSYVFTPYLNKYKNMWAYVQEGIANYTGSLNMCYDRFVGIGEGYNRIIGWNILSTAENSTLKIYRLENGAYAYATAKVSDEDITDMASSVGDFREFLDEREVDFLYINAGTKICKLENVVPAHIEDYANENQDALLAALKEQGISVLDVREMLHESGMEHAGAYYVQDPHWKNETALWSAGEVAEYANANYGFSFDLSNFAISNYKVELHEKAFIGSQGLALHIPDSEKENYETVFPNFETEFYCRIPTKGFNMTGGYEDVFVDEADLEIATRMYQSWSINNDAMVHIENLRETNNSDKKILLLYDSFAWPFMTYLATDVGQIDALHLKNYYGSVKSYVDAMEPDLVIMMYSGRNIEPIDRNTRTSLFDLR